jgi:hypothetical protein
MPDPKASYVLVKPVKPVNRGGTINIDKINVRTSSK